MTNNTIEKRLIFSLFLAVFLLYGCGSKDQAEVPIIKKKVQVQEIALQSELTTGLKASGTVVPKEYSVIRSLTPGTVNYLVPVGSEVYVGQPLFSLSDSSIESAYFNANRSFEQTRVISNQKVTQAELALNGAKARLDLARSQYNSALAQSEQALKVAEDSAIVAYDSAYNISNQILNYLMMGGN